MSVRGGTFCCQSSASHRTKWSVESAGWEAGERAFSQLSPRFSTVLASFRFSVDNSSDTLTARAVIDKPKIAPTSKMRKPYRTNTRFHLLMKELDTKWHYALSYRTHKQKLNPGGKARFLVQMQIKPEQKPGKRTGPAGRENVWGTCYRPLRDRTSPWRQYLRIWSRSKSPLT
uniref:Uncharacterized protein n=1 Tax=uncultured prokaryote TaxID=198431 RepID=A0A0H5QJQ1_9ZZZZ|nr:hypothetical protein [uncultured prokaryote]